MGLTDDGILLKVLKIYVSGELVYQNNHIYEQNGENNTCILKPPESLELEQEAINHRRLHTRANK